MFDRVFELDQKFDQDDCRLLLPVSTFLAENSESASFLVRKDPFGALLGRPAVRVKACLGDTPALDNRTLYNGLLDAAQGSEVTLTEQLRFTNGKPVAGNVLLTDTSPVLTPVP